MSFARALHLLFAGGSVACFILAQVYVGWVLASRAGFGLLFVAVVAVGAVAAVLTKIAARARHDH